MMLFRIFRDPTELARNLEVLKSMIYDVEEEVVEFVMHENYKVDKKEKARYVSGHYNDAQLIAHLNASSREHKLFDSNVRDVVWEKLYFAKEEIDPFLLKQKITNHIVTISVEDELTPFEFFIHYINMSSLIKNDGENLWHNYFGPLSMTIFKQIQKLRHDYLPIYLFARYPFDIKELLDDLEQFYEQSPDYDEKKSLSTLTKQDLLFALNKLKFLNCKDDVERQYILNSIEANNNEYKDEKNIQNAIFPKFVVYLQEVASLFQQKKKIKNMLRDVNTAIIERGADASLFADQLYFLFDDIKNSIVALPFFNSMRTESSVGYKGGELKVELWTIRTTLKALYFLHHTTRREIINKNKKKYVSIDEILDIVFDLYHNDIIDPHGITKRIRTEAKNKIMKNDDCKEEKNDVVLPLQRSRKPSLIADEEEDDGTEEYEQLKEARQLIAQQRMELFHKQEITASAIKIEVESIFDKLQKRRILKVTETTIDFYRRNGLKNVRLLQDDECLRFIYEQLARYMTFNPGEMKSQCDLNLLKKILCNTLGFDVNSTYKIDDETVPKMVRNNDKYIEQLYAHLSNVFKLTQFSGLMKKDSKTKMLLEDVVSIIMLYQRIFSVVQQKIIDSADEFVVNHDLFCKFVDPIDFSLDISHEKWSNKTRAASTLYQSVLDIQQNFVTLGQIRQTINILLSDINAMHCGELIRLINHIGSKMRNDMIRCREQRKLYLKEIQSVNEVMGFDTLPSVDEVAAFTINEINEKEEEQQHVAGSQFGKFKSVRLLQATGIENKTKRKNPSLQFKHNHAITWNNFIRHIAHKFHHDITSKEVFDKLQNDDDINNNDKEIIDVIIENTQFDIIINDEQKIDVDVILETKESKFEEDEEVVKKEEEENEMARKLKKARFDVFDTILSFNAHRITLQQLFAFARQFRAFLKANKTINNLMKNYMSNILGVSDENNNDGMNIIDQTNELKRDRISSNFQEFKNKYFNNENFKCNKRIKLEDFVAEIEWLYENTENIYVLCQRIYPFWGSDFIQSIYNFMESTEKIQGIYELKSAEFGQLKYSLNVNHENANKLFHIIRFKIRSLSWRQLYNYFIFILRMKYNVQKAILNSTKCEDTTISHDGMKILLKISLNDESKWLFDKTLFFNGSKVTWKQIKSYLRKIVSVRDDMRDFFNDQERDRNYIKNKAEIISEISENVEKNNKHNAININQQQEIINILQSIQSQNNNLKKEIDALKTQLKQK